MGYSFFPPKKFKATSQSVCCTNSLCGINRSSSYENYTALQKVLEKLKASETVWKQRLKLGWLCMPKNSDFDLQR